LHGKSFHGVSNVKGTAETSIQIIERLTDLTEENVHTLAFL
jgi:hypothetical protein